MDAGSGLALASVVGGLKELFNCLCFKGSENDDIRGRRRREDIVGEINNHGLIGRDGVVWDGRGGCMIDTIHISMCRCGKLETWGIDRRRGCWLQDGARWRRSSCRVRR